MKYWARSSWLVRMMMIAVMGAEIMTLHPRIDAHIKNTSAAMMPITPITSMITPLFYARFPTSTP